MTDTPDLAVLHCSGCQGRYLPRPGACPRCGSREVVEARIPPSAVVLAATELAAPSAGWSAPHRLAIVEAAEQVRILGIVRGPIPAPGDAVTVRRVNELYEIGPTSGDGATSGR